MNEELVAILTFNSLGEDCVGSNMGRLGFMVEEETIEMDINSVASGIEYWGNCCGQVHF